MNPLTRVIFNNIHPASFLISSGAVLAGLTAAVLRGGISLLPSLLTLLFAVLLQISCNLYNGYFDMLYAGGDNIAASSTGRDLRSHSAARVRLVRVVANGFVMLTITAGLPLFTFIGWIGIAYFAVILLILFFFYAGPKPLARTPWAIVITFILFGPVAVSGTALIQDFDNRDWFPILIYSLISGLMACNACISVMCQFYQDDLDNGKNSLIISKGYGFVRWMYIINSLVVATILFIRPCVSDNLNTGLGMVMGIVVLLSSVLVARYIKGNSPESVAKIRITTRIQYIGVMILLMVTVMIASDGFKFNFFHLV